MVALTPGHPAHWLTPGADATPLGDECGVDHSGNAMRGSLPAR